MCCLGGKVNSIFLNARKLRPIAHSSSRSEIFPESEGSSTLKHIKHFLGELSYHHDAALFDKSRPVINVATSILEPTEESYKMDLSLIREHFAQDLIDKTAWMQGYHSIPDCFNMDKRKTASWLLCYIRERIYLLRPDCLS